VTGRPYKSSGTSSSQQRPSFFETEPDVIGAINDAESKTVAEDFAAFWLAYPVHIGRLAALKAYAKARKLAPAADILAGIDRYIANKPAWQAFAHASSWLNAGRWADEFMERRRAPRTCPHTPPCVEGPNWRCHQRTEMDRYRNQR
jgi:hypothetical protein